MTTRPTRHADTTDLDPDSDSDANATFVVGGGPTGRVVAERLTARGESVTFVDRASLPDPPPGHDVRRVDSFDVDALRSAGLENATTVVVLSGDDACNLMVAQHARSRFGADRVVVTVNDPERRSAFDALGVETVDTPAAIGNTVTEHW